MPTVFFSHGKESGPWGTKISTLAAIAESMGYAVESPDYTDLADPEQRVERLLGLCRPGEATVLVGSSMGGYVAAVAARQIRPKALFLMAPAFYRHGYAVQEPEPCATKTVIVHGWDDDVIPADSSIRYARKYAASLHLVQDGHRLEGQLTLLSSLFRHLLEQITA